MNALGEAILLEASFNIFINESIAPDEGYYYFWLSSPLALLIRNDIIRRYTCS